MLFKAIRSKRAASLTVITALSLMMLPASASAAPADGGEDRPGRPEVRIDATPEIIKLIPAKAAVAVMVPKLEAVQTEVGALMKAIGVDADEAKTPVTTMLKQAGLAEGVDLKRGMAVVLPTFNLMGEPKPIILLPITGEGAFLANFQGVEKVEEDGDLLQGGTKGGNLGQAVMRIKGGYAQLAQEAGQLRQFEAGAGDAGALWKRLGKVGQSQFAMNQATAYLNLEQVGPMVAPLVQMGLMQAKAQMRKNPEQAEALGGPEAAAAMVDMYGRALKAVLTQSRALVMGLSGDAEGAAIRYGVQFKPGTEPAKMFTPAAAPKLTLNRLPAGEAMIAGVMDMRAVNLAPVVEGFAAAVKQMPEDGPMTKLMGLYGEAMEMAGMVNQAAFAWYAPELKEGEQPGPETPVDMALVYTSDDPKKLAAANTDYNESVIGAMTELAKQQGLDEQAYEKLRAAMKVERGVEKLNGKPVDRMTYDMEAMAMGPGDVPEAMTGAQNIYWTATDGALVGATGKTMDRLKQTLGTAGGTGKLGGGSGYRALRKHLPADRFAEFFIDVSAFGKWAMAMEGDGKGAAAMPKMAPMAMSMTSQAGGGGATVYLPSGMLKEAVEGLGPLLRLFMGGMPGGGGGAAPAPGF